MSSYTIISEVELSDKKKRLNVAIVIDVFRAFTTAAYVLDKNPASYAITTQSSVISKLSKAVKNPLLIGKPEIGANLLYTIPNSPTRVSNIIMADKNVLHRTNAGASGILMQDAADIIFATSFVNAVATVKYIKTLFNPRVSIFPMGHEATTPSLEDDICCEYIKALLSDREIDLKSFIPSLKEGAGRYFFGSDQRQYPEADFNCCLEVGRFDFTTRAVVKGDYAILRSLRMI